MRVPSTDTFTVAMPAASLMAQPPKAVTPPKGPLWALGVSMLMRVGFAVVQLATVKLLPTVETVPSAAVAVTAKLCVPFASLVVSSRNDQPTLGQPARPGYALQTSGRLPP